MTTETSAIDRSRTTSQTTSRLGRWSNLDRDKLEQAIVGYLFLLPDVLGLFVFFAIPMVMAVVVSLSDWRLVGQPQFIGLQNYDGSC